MTNYDENSNILKQIENSETKSLKIPSEVEKHDISVDELTYGINKPKRIIIKAKISHGKN